MKKLLLIATAVVAAMSASAQTTDLYLTGSNINGTSWSPNAADAKMTYQDGVYVWEGTELGSEFKFTNGTWGTQWSTDNDTRCELGTPYKIVAKEVKNIFLSVTKVNNPKVVVDLEALTVTVTGTADNSLPVYIIGDNVNGSSWKLLKADAKMTDKGNGIYEWDGEVLGSGFKLNNGSWSEDKYNWGVASGAAPLKLGEEYQLIAGGSSSNIAFDGMKEVKNPHVVFDINTLKITVTGEGAGEVNWYVTGCNNSWNLGDAERMTKVADGVYEKTDLELTQAGEFKIVNDGWAIQFGNGGSVQVDAEHLSVTLDGVSDGGNVPYFITGTYDVRWDLNTHVVTFTDKSGVAGIVAAPAEKTYYNLQGLRVANPEHGQLYIVVESGRASKVRL